MFDVLFHDKFDDCNNADVPFPTNIWFADNVVVPIPPLEIVNVPAVALLIFILVIAEPEPTKIRLW